MEIGKTQKLTIVEKTASGYYLGESERIFIANIFAESHWKVGEEVSVFIYQDGEQLKATTEQPFAEVEEFAVMQCVKVMPSGAFMDWGIIKDLFIPYKEQKGKLQESKRYLVYVYIDEATGLITGTTKFKRNASYQDISLKKGEKVRLIIMNETELGWNVVINQKYLGLVYQSEVYKKLYPLSEEVGYIKSIREDGKIDVALQPEGYENIEMYKEQVMSKLEEHYGLLYLSDKSSPEEIKEALQMSKKNFKKAIGSLYKEKKIALSEESIRLL